MEGLQSIRDVFRELEELWTPRTHKQESTEKWENLLNRLETRKTQEIQEELTQIVFNNSI